MSDNKTPEKKLPPTHDSHELSRRVLEEDQVDQDQLRSKLSGRFSEIVTEFKQTVICTDRDNVIGALEILRSDPELDYKMITDITVVDNMRRTDFDPERRFTVVHIVYSVTHKKRVRLETNLSEGSPRIPTASGVYKGAAWIEREAYDMFGVEFEGHADLRRVLMPDYYEHFVLRKDYPLTGRGERDNFVRAEEVE
ncbi:MAG: NADH-quinone oxidoreductase subunit C [Planctomycetes bacterium]|nr:NADH-quinone oxidoreductase subunit C [Planctomycetota bacterium]